ncbi:response regulator [Pseudacidovorax intermedius]|uniref:Histidine kinase n=1 Tax=Pseudacidovorax intermedius TaxID=433924 RepID=A0A147GP12_9BURK|nr:response regulator [Pseudacidovorax intermedius]KTT16100.1 histidine kinase [Pseudacidovorax intermedius]
MKILIADDSRAMRMVVAHAIRQAGFRGHETMEAPDGAKALELATSEHFGLIISDWNMPNMTGIEFLQKLREAEIDTPFGFVTTEVSSEMRQQATALGAKFVIGKPFSPEDFEKALGPILD